MAVEAMPGNPLGLLDGKMRDGRAQRNSSDLEPFASLSEGTRTRAWVRMTQDDVMGKIGQERRSSL